MPEQVFSEIAADPREHLVLHGLRVRGLAAPEAIAETVGLSVDEVRAVLEVTTERGHTRIREGRRFSGYSLTPAGRTRHVLLLSDSLSPEERSGVVQARQAFLEPNRALKQLTTDTQLNAMEGDATLVRLEEVHRRVSEVVATAAASVPRFAVYDERLSAALERVRGGDVGALARPMSGSYHDVWMELHEDLLVTLGEERTEADG